MNFLESIDLNENYLLNNYPKLLETLLFDNTTKQFIIWGTDSYKEHGCFFIDQMTPEFIGKNNIIRPRSKKAEDEKIQRSKSSAEVFTPSWMCNKQNNLIDSEWFGSPCVFNKEMDNNTWKTTEGKIIFPQGKTWVDYLTERRLEITCGEAPYIVSRYDTVSGTKINISNRIGILDRKFRVLNENVTEKEEWINYSIEAIKSIFGYEWQGDNLLLARENILLSYMDYYFNKFNELPAEKLLLEIAIIVSWNFWQMDGMKFVVPYSCRIDREPIVDVFGNTTFIDHECVGCLKDNVHKHNGTYCLVMDWKENKPVRFVDIILGGHKHV